MSSRTLGTVLVLGSFAGVLALSSASGGCSDDEAPAATDAGADRAPDVNRAPPAADDAATPKSCRKACEEAHPTAIAKDEAIDTCWETFCSDPCIEELPIDGGIVADGAAPDGGTCSAPVLTTSLDCDQCTNTSCCASWDGCFEDTECAALNACYQECDD
ncbi:MAG: hypothetical protein KF795_28155 [Labilithrix sp.]|nr:hypothetical protein [Labilithrix sp.]